MMHGFKSGMYQGWSPYFDFSSYENLIKSEELPIPNKNKYILESEETIKNGLLSVDISGDLAVLKTIGEPNLEFMINLLNKVKSYSVIKPIEDPDFDKVVNIIKEHNSYEYPTAGLKNFVVRNIWATSNHPNNQISSYSPIDFGEYEGIKKSRENNFVLTLMDGISMDQQQETNAVGKDVIGIAANGIKDYFSLVEYFSNYYRGDIKATDNEYFEREFNITGLGNVKTNRIAGLNLEKKAIEILNTYVGNQLGKELNPYGDPALILSSLLSASTDNAKELILKAINAGKEFASMHIYLIILGFNEGEVAKFMTSPEILSLLNDFKSNIFVKGQEKKSSDTVVSKIDENNTTPEKREFKKIFSLAKELSFLAGILKINQGLKASPEVLYGYFNKIQSEFVTRERELVNSYKQSLIATKVVEKDAPVESYLDKIVLADKQYLRGNEPYVRTVLNEAIRNNIVNGNFSYEKYFSDANYKKAAIDYYNLIKGTYNVLDVIEKLPHFKGMVDAAWISYNNLKNSSKKFKFVVNDVIDVLANSKLDTVRFKLFGTNTVSLGENHINNSFDLFDDLIISKWFKNEFKKNPPFEINLKNLKSLDDRDVFFYSENGVLNMLKDEDITLDFTNDLDLFNFKLAMERNILPYLKIKYPENRFLSGLIERKRMQNEKERTWLSTRVRMNRLIDPKNLDLLHHYQKGFDELFESNKKIRIGDKEVNISDLFFLYNLIVNKDRFGSDRLTKLFRNYVTDINSISRDFYEFYTKIDSGEEELFDEDFPLDDKMKKIIEYGVLNNKGKLVITRGKYDRDSDTTGQDVVLRVPNPNFTLATALEQSAPEYQKDNAFKALMKYINNNNLLIRFNCE